MVLSSVTQTASKNTKTNTISQGLVFSDFFGHSTDLRISPQRPFTTNCHQFGFSTTFTSSWFWKVSNWPSTLFSKINFFIFHETRDKRLRLKPALVQDTDFMNGKTYHASVTHIWFKRCFHIPKRSLEHGGQHYLLSGPKAISFGQKQPQKTTWLRKLTL